MTAFNDFSLSLVRGNRTYGEVSKRPLYKYGPPGLKQVGLVRDVASLRLEARIPNLTALIILLLGRGLRRHLHLLSMAEGV
jgi:hypothetical protein